MPVRPDSQKIFQGPDLVDANLFGFALGGDAFYRGFAVFVASFTSSRFDQAEIGVIA